MLKSRILVDLPSAETERGKNPIEWVRSLFGAKLDLRSGKEELTVSAFSLVEGLVEGFSRAGVTDVISFIVDKKVVYMDSAEVADDLPLVLEAAEQKGVLARKFGQMHLVLSHKAEGLHTLLDVRILSQVLLGSEEMQVDLSSRIESLRVQTGESAEAYSARVRAFMTDAQAIEQYRLRQDALTDKVAAGLRGSLVGAKVTTEPASVEIIRPRAEQIGRFRNLSFGDEVLEPHYRGVPTHQRVGAYADPFFYYYYDPYYDFMSWVMLDSLLHHNTWHSPHVHVVDTDGYELGTSANLATVSDGWAGRDAVTFGDDGGVHVARSIPEVSESSALPAASWSSGDATSSSDSGSGGDGWGWSGGGGDSGSADSGGSSCSSASSCSSSSSCGSSCGGSSCGSSCGGGGGGD